MTSQRIGTYGAIIDPIGRATIRVSLATHLLRGREAQQQSFSPHATRELDGYFGVGGGYVAGGGPSPKEAG